MQIPLSLDTQGLAQSPNIAASVQRVLHILVDDHGRCQGVARTSNRNTYDVKFARYLEILVVAIQAEHTFFRVTAVCLFLHHGHYLFSLLLRENTRLRGRK
jgi:hypothetical protein